MVIKKSRFHIGAFSTALVFLQVILAGSLPVFAQERVSIVAHPGDSVVHDLAEELKGWLEKAAGSQSFYIVGRQSGDPFIQLAVMPGMNDSLHKGGFSINGHGKQLVIAANHLNGLRNGVYYYLNLLGFRFYLPGENWTHVPRLQTVFLQLHKTVSPVFMNRALFPSGGLKKNPVIDPDDQYRKTWDQWLARNLYSSEEKIDGHMGEDFNNKHKKELLADTSLLAQVKGRRQWSLSAKWCVSNPAFVRLFVQDRLEAFALMKKRFPDRNLISVEPADGYGDCECANCQKMGTVSDRYFYLANQAAAAIARQWPGGGVSLFAYNTHAAVPGIQLLPNVYVTVIPYRFQAVTDPSVLLAMWREKCAHIGVYDYWCITSACMDVPLFNYLQQLPGKYALWQNLGLKGFLLETGYSKFNNALAFYCFSRMQWFGETDLIKILHQFCEDNFGKASAVIYNMLERWGIHYKLHYELPNSLREIQTAYSLETDRLVHKRLDELQAAVQYAALQDWALSSITKPGSEQRTDSLLKFIWSVYDQGIINTAIISDLIRQRMLAAKLNNTGSWNINAAEKNSAFWLSVYQHPFTEPLPGYISNPSSYPVLNGVTYPLQDEKIIDSFLLNNRKPSANDTVKFRSPAQLSGSVLSDKAGTLEFLITRVNPLKNAGQLPVVALFDEAGVFYGYRAIGPGVTPQKIVFKNLRATTRYLFTVFACGNFDIAVSNRFFLLDGDMPGSAGVKLVSHQQPVLLLAGNTYPHFLNVAGFSGKLINATGGVVLDKPARSAARNDIYKCSDEGFFLNIQSNTGRPFTLQGWTTRTIYGFFLP